MSIVTQFKLPMQQTRQQFSNALRITKFPIKIRKKKKKKGKVKQCSELTVTVVQHIDNWQKGIAEAK